MIAQYPSPQQNKSPASTSKKAPKNSNQTPPRKPEPAPNTKYPATDHSQPAHSAAKLKKTLAITREAHLEPYVSQCFKPKIKKSFIALR